MSAQPEEFAAASPLRQALEGVIAESGGALKDYTVLADQNDPFRVDTPARHRDGQWLAITARELGLGDRKIHLRGLHYKITMAPIPYIKPNGTPYVNTDRDWLWLSEDAAKAARWLGYLPWDQIFDKRNAPPVVRGFEKPEPWPYIDVGIEVDIPDAKDLVPRVGIADFRGTQPYKLIIFGEKSSLEEVLGPIAEEYQADLYLATGEISDTLIYQMASTSAQEGRPMVVLCFSDCDPSGWQMPISIARKLQAFETLLPMPGFQVERGGLTPDQVRRYGLPTAPLKDKEKRKDDWIAAMGVEQTEIDAMVARPDDLARLARDAIEPFYDTGLARRVADARQEWLREAISIVSDGLDHDQLERLRAEAGEKLATLRSEIDAINEAMRIDAADFQLPVPVVPMARVAGGNGKPLVDSRWPFAEQCRALIDSKEYRS